ncbi:MAG: hypothetical protein C4567_18700 [Deltaproteobacteria bacterium]|nr:MAG: hypothetical protein C4567_18700 [Deltaproteobacteria bacterium]
MSDFERQKFERRLIVLETEVVPIDLEIVGYRDSLRDLLDPLLPTSQLQLKIAADLAVKAAARQIDLKAKLAEIAKLKGMLGKE